MTPRVTVAAGLLSGVAVTLGVLAAAVAFLPDPGAGAAGSELTAPSGAASAGTSVAPASGSPASGAPTAPEPTVVASIGASDFRVGEAAPALNLTQLGGGRIDLVKLSGRPVWVYFMQATCPQCVESFSVVNGFAARYAETGLVVIAIDVREDEGAVAAFALRVNATIPIGLDPDGAAQAVWGAAALPAHFWVDRDGIIRAAALGGIGPDTMAEKLSSILPGVVVTP